MSDDLTTLGPLATERLDLRPLGADDAAAVREVTDDPGILAIVPFLAQPFTEARARALIAWRESRRDLFWGAWRRDDGRLLGVVGTHLRGAAELEIGYWFNSAHHGCGYASEAVAAMTAALRDAFPERDLIAEALPDNAASLRVLEKAGFRLTGEHGKRPGRQLLRRDA